MKKTEDIGISFTCQLVLDKVNIECCEKGLVIMWHSDSLTIRVLNQVGNLG